MMDSPISLFAFLLLISGCCAPSIALSANQKEIISDEAVSSWEYPTGYSRVSYGEDPLQFGDLRVPEGEAPHPVAILIPGGWTSDYDIGQLGRAAAALTDAGVATWTLEFRRVGNDGGGWPGTFQDIARGSDYIRVLAKNYPLDLERLIYVGHSSGGQFALWAGSRNRLNRDSEFISEEPIPHGGVLALAPTTDLVDYYNNGSASFLAGGLPGVSPEQVAIGGLLGGSPEQVPERYRKASIVEMLPLGIRQIVLFGKRDKYSDKRYYQKARLAGDDIDMIEAPTSGHYEMIDPESSATWDLVVAAVFDLLGVSVDNQRVSDVEKAEE